MSVLALPPAPGPLPPWLADPAAVAGFATELLAVSAQLDDAGSFASGGARLPAWEGRAADAYAARARPWGRRCDALSLALRQVARRADAHAETLSELGRRHQELAERREALLGALDALRARAVLAPPGSPVLPELAALAEDLARGVAGLDAEIAGWSAALAAEEQAMRRAFERLLTVAAAEARHGSRPDPADAALASMPAAGASAHAVRAWWRGLSAAQRAALVAAAPGAIGNRDGVPAGARDAANRVALARDLAAWSRRADHGRLDEHGQRWLENARAARRALTLVEAGEDPVTGEPVPATLYLYDPDAFGGDGRVAIAAGDLATADNVALTVPGLGTDAGSAPFQAQRALTLHEASRYLEPGETNATLAWIGYDAPDNVPWRGDGLDAVGVLGEGHARAGGERLADDLDGLRASRPGEPAHLTVIGHSYGSTTTGHAAAGPGIPVDDLVFVGSPGVGEASTAQDTGVEPEHVWAGANSRDPVVDLGNRGWLHLESALDGQGLGGDPAEDDFGARRFRAESADRPRWWSTAEHQRYFDHDTESLFNLATIVNGDADRVLEAEPVTDPWYRPPRDPEWDRAPEPASTRPPR